jgi:hypothetical protein
MISWSRIGSSLWKWFAVLIRSGGIVRCGHERSGGLRLSWLSKRSDASKFRKLGRVKRERWRRRLARNTYRCWFRDVCKDARYVDTSRFGRLRRRQRKIN